MTDITAPAPTAFSLRKRAIATMRALVAGDQTYCRKLHANRLDDRLLGEAGMTRDELEKAFRELHANNRYRPRMYL